MDNSSIKCILMCIIISSLIYILGSGSYISYLLVNNNQLIENAKCIDINIKNEKILKRIDNWNYGYNIVGSVSGYTKLKCPTSYPIVYNIINNSLVSYMKADDPIMNYNIKIIDCNNKLKYTVNVGDFIILNIHGDIKIASVDIRKHNKTIYYIKKDIYDTNDIDIYDIDNSIVTNLKYTDNLWNISIYDNIDDDILLSLINYHNYYIHNFHNDGCNKFVKISYALIFCFSMLLCCSCFVYTRHICIYVNGSKHYESMVSLEEDL